MIEELKQIYKEKSEEINQRLSIFKKIREDWNPDILFRELCFCLLTPQSKARSADKAIQALLKDKKLYTATAEEIAEELNIVRFKNNKSRYIVELREKFFTNKNNIVLQILESDIPIYEKRKLLVKNVKGIGFKEASHYLRNIGFYDEVTILDRHILRLMVENKNLKEMPKSITEKNYYEIETKLIQLSGEIKIPLAQLDFVIWYKQANDIFK
jgi:N-glycosylase/DNA lyase